LIGSKISSRYAKALFSLGQDDGHYKEYGQNLNEFVSFCSTNNEFIRVVSNQLYPVDDRKKVLEVVLEKSLFSNVVKNFLRLLVDKNRIVAIDAITDYYSRLTDELSNITRADIITAKPLKKKALDNLKRALTGLTSKDVRTDVKQDDTLIGGLIVKIGDLILDGSVKTQLEGLKESLKRGEYN
jgi:F-type H+-transporting ATPase subunit delta